MKSLSTMRLQTSPSIQLYHSAAMSVRKRCTGFSRVWIVNTTTLQFTLLTVLQMQSIVSRIIYSFRISRYSGITQPTATLPTALWIWIRLCSGLRPVSAPSTRSSNPSTASYPRCYLRTSPTSSPRALPRYN
ncbi:Hypothetical_protein [Hexamita inflata]|uniref:Hypothetical_protein n=1 Tax=Hexamita inflata TaxID=28002 RepID=A0AA86UL31_9EUKA|nr:Hypothetical protein HINF_LOCUS43276 [Hexamita inflata]